MTDAEAVLRRARRPLVIGMGGGGDVVGALATAEFARIYDGADEVHRQTVARIVLKDYSKPEGIYPTDHIPTRREAARQKFANLLETITANA